MELAVQDMLGLNQEPHSSTSEQGKAGILTMLCRMNPLKRMREPKRPRNRIVVSDLVERLDCMLEGDPAYFQDASLYDTSSFIRPPSFFLPFLECEARLNHSKYELDSYTEC